MTLPPLASVHALSSLSAEEASPCHGCLGRIYTQGSTAVSMNSNVVSERIKQWMIIAVSERGWRGRERLIPFRLEHVRFTCPLCGVFVSICIINFHNSNHFIRTMHEKFSQINKIRPPPNCKWRCVWIYAGEMVARLSAGSNFVLFRAALEKDRFGGRSQVGALVIHHFCRVSRPSAARDDDAIFGGVEGRYL